jgi:hypothetical protein
MSEPAPRRRFQLSLWTLFAFTTIVAVVSWTASFTRANWAFFYIFMWMEFYMLLIVARTIKWRSQKKSPRS